MNTTVKTLISFAAGTAAGLIAGYLTAPRSGENTRKKIVSDLENTKESIENAASQKLNEARSLLNKAAENQLDKGKELLDKTKDALLN